MFRKNYSPPHKGVAWEKLSRVNSWMMLNYLMSMIVVRLMCSDLWRVERVSGV